MASQKLEERMVAPGAFRTPCRLVGERRCGGCEFLLSIALTNLPGLVSFICRRALFNNLVTVSFLRSNLLLLLFEVCPLITALALAVDRLTQTQNSIDEVSQHICFEQAQLTDSRSRSSYKSCTRR